MLNFHHFIAILFLCIGTQAAAQFTNILIDREGNPEEPSICIDPKYPNRIVAGANIRYVYASEDTGRTWVKNSIDSRWNASGDPCILVDTAGAFYYFSLSNADSWLDRLICQKSLDGGKHWGTECFIGFDVLKDQDKEWGCVDPATNAIYLTWTQFDRYGSTSSYDSSHILFSRSLDGGETWSEPLRINERGGDCLDGDNTVEGAVPAVGPEGQIYVSWAGPQGLTMDYSLDGGEHWLARDISIGSIPGGWTYDIPGIYRCNGLPITLCDRSDGAYRGRVYVHWSDQRSGEEDTDLWLAGSDDGGKSWSVPVRVNRDTGRVHQFMSWMTIDPVTGYLWAVYYDRRNHSGTDSTDVYLSWSTNGGASFSDTLISHTPFLPNKRVFFGDYSNISVYNQVVRPVWTRMDSNKLSIWTAWIDGRKLTGVGASVELEVQPE